MACLYFADVDEVTTAAKNNLYAEVTGKHRCFIYLAEENKHLEELAEVKSEFQLKMSVLKVHECLVPFLVRTDNQDVKGIDESLVVVDTPQTFWVGDVDIWINFPDKIENALASFFPQSAFIAVSKH
jgi:hypothetical protein